jgi:MFS family permease
MKSTNTAANASTPQVTPLNRRILIAFFLVVVFLYWIGLYLYVPTLPLYIQTKTSDLAMVGTALSMYGLWQIVSRLPLGILVDWVGRRKPFILVWLVLVAVGDYALGTSTNISTATVGRAIVGIAAGCWVPLVVMFSGLFRPDEVVKSTAILSMVGLSGRIVATAANGWLNHLGGYPLAFQLASMAALAGCAVLLFIPDARIAPKKPSFGQLGRLFTCSDIMLPSLLQALLHVGDFAASYTFIPILARLKGASDIAVSALISLNLGMGFIGSWASPRLVQKIGPQAVTILSFALIAAGMGGSALAPTLAVVFLFQFMIGMGVGIGYPLLMAMSIEQVDNSERTTAMGLHQSVYSVGMFVGPWLGGILASALGLPPMFVIIGAASLVFGVLGARRLQVFTPGGVHLNPKPDLTIH